MRRLRRKIDDGFEPKLIHTLRGAGYRFGMPVVGSQFPVPGGGAHG